MMMFRPWRQDDRPAWWTRIVHEVLEPLDDTDRDAVKKQAHDTGLARWVLVTEDLAAGTVSVYLLVKADSAEEAALVATRIAKAGHREAGHGRLGRRVRGAARPHRTPPTPPDGDGGREA